MVYSLLKQIKHYKKDHPPTALLTDNASTQKAALERLDKELVITQDNGVQNQRKLETDFDKINTVYNIDMGTYKQGLSNYKTEISNTVSNLNMRLQAKQQNTTAKIDQYKDEMDRYINNRFGPFSSIDHMYSNVGYDKNTQTFWANDYTVIDSGGRPVIKMTELKAQMDSLLQIMSETEGSNLANFNSLSTLSSNVNKTKEEYLKEVSQNSNEIQGYKRTFQSNVASYSNDLKLYISEESNAWSTKMENTKDKLIQDIQKDINTTTGIFGRLAADAERYTISNTNSYLTDTVSNVMKDITDYKSNLATTTVQNAQSVLDDVTSNMNSRIDIDIKSNLTTLSNINLSNTQSNTNFQNILGSNYLKTSELNSFISDEDNRGKRYRDYIFSSLRSNIPNQKLYANDYVLLSNVNGVSTGIASFKITKNSYTETQSNIERKVFLTKAGEISNRVFTQDGLKMQNWNVEGGGHVLFGQGKMKMGALGANNNVLHIGNENNPTYVELNNDLRIRGYNIVDEQGNYLSSTGTQGENISQRINNLIDISNTFVTTSYANTILSNMAPINHVHTNYIRKDDPAYSNLKEKINNMFTGCIPSNPNSTCINGSNIHRDTVLTSDNFGISAVPWEKIDWSKVQHTPEVANSLRGVCDTTKISSDNILWSTGASGKVPVSNIDMNNIPFGALRTNTRIDREAMVQTLGIQSTSNLSSSNFVAGSVGVSNWGDITNQPILSNMIKRTNVNEERLKPSQKVSANKLKLYPDNYTDIINTSNFDFRPAEVGTNKFTYKGDPVVFNKYGKKCFVLNNNIVCDPVDNNQVVVCRKNSQPPTEYKCQQYNISVTTVADVPKPFKTYSATAETNQALNNINTFVPSTYDTADHFEPFAVGDGFQLTADNDSCTIGNLSSQVPSKNSICSMRTNKISSTTASSNVLLQFGLSVNNRLGDDDSAIATCQNPTPTEMEVIRNRIRDVIPTADQNDITYSVQYFNPSAVRKSYFDVDNIKSSGTNLADLKGNLNVSFTASNCSTISCSIQSAGYLSQTSGSSSQSPKDAVCSRRTNTALPVSTNQEMDATVVFSVTNAESATDSDIKNACFQSYNGSWSKDAIKGMLLSTDLTVGTISGCTTADMNVANRATPMCSIKAQTTASNCSTGVCVEASRTISYLETNNNPISDSATYCTNNIGASIQKRITITKSNRDYPTQSCLSESITTQETCHPLRYVLDGSPTTDCYRKNINASTYSKLETSSSQQSGVRFQKIKEIVSSDDPQKLVLGANLVYSLINNVMTPFTETRQMIVASTSGTNVFIETTDACSTTCTPSFTYSYRLAPRDLQVTTSPSVPSFNTLKDSYKSSCTSVNQNVVIGYEKSNSCDSSVEHKTIQGHCDYPCSITINSTQSNLATNMPQVLSTLNNNCVNINDSSLSNCGVLKLSDIFKTDSAGVFSPNLSLSLPVTLTEIPPAGS